MSIKVQRTGLFDTLQDPGRTGFRSYGVATGGWFDGYHARLANALAGSEPDAPCIELTQASGLFRVEDDLLIAVAGPGARIRIYDPDKGYRVFQNSVAAWLAAGSSIEVEHPQNGFRSYLAAGGGRLGGKLVLGSVSTEQRLLSGETVLISKVDKPVNRSGPFRQLSPELFGKTDGKAVIDFIPSSDYQKFSIDKNRLCNWRLTPQSNRVGLRFDHPLVDSFKSEWPVEPGRLSQPVMPGTMQWTGRELIILGPAGGTMGGYPTLGQVSRACLDRLAQLPPGYEVHLNATTPEEARAAYRSQVQSLNRICHRIRSATY